jgi:energy-coupling factor transport system substrate-specific component
MAHTGKSIETEQHRSRAHLFTIIMAIVMAAAVIALVTLTLLKAGSAFAWMTIAIPTVLALIFWILDKTNLTPETVGILAAVIAIACALRAIRIPVQGIQFTSWLVMLVGFALGPHAGFLAGALIPLISNFYLGQGSWTAWQMLAWGLIGACAGWISLTRLARNRWLTGLFGLLSGWIFGFFMNLESFLYMLGTQKTGLWQVILLGLPFDTLSGVVTGVLLILTIPWATDLIHRTSTRIS